jgi:ribosomal protein L34E
MAGATHPFFGNQYTDGGYEIGSFKFPEGLTREITERLTDIHAPDKDLGNTDSIPSVHENRETFHLDTVDESETQNGWVILAFIKSAIAAVGSYIAYKYFKKKRIIKIPNIGVCEKCGEPLTGAKFMLNSNSPYITCKKCGEKNYAHYSSENISRDNISEDLNREDGEI